MKNLVSWVLGGIAAALGITNTTLGGVSASKDREYNAREAQANRDFQLSERLESQQFELDMWNLNNEYNSIGSQIQRARDAGVNPASIIGGDYKSAQSSPVTTTPSSGSQASTTAGAQFASALMGNNPMSAFNDAYGKFVDSKVKQDSVKITRDQLNETIRLNNGQLVLIAKQAGVADATEEQIRKSIGWMDELNYTDVLERRADVMKIYNDNYISFQRLALDAQSTAADIEYKGALTDDVEAQTAYQNIVNKYADETLSAQATIEEVRAFEYGLRKSIAEVLGVPLGSSEFEFNYVLLRNGQWFEYVDTILKGETDATLKPSERVVPIKHSFNADLGLNIGKKRRFGLSGGYTRDSYINYMYEPLTPSAKGYMNPIYNPAQQLWVAPMLYPY